MARKPTLAKRASAADAETAQPLERRHRVRLADQLYGQIFEQLVSGNLSVGDKLPSENEISERYGVRGRWCARRCCACAPTGWSRRIRAGHLRQPPARAQAQDLQRRGARQRLSARAGGAGGAGRRCRAPGGPAPHRRAVAQDRGGAPGLRRIAGAGAHVGRGRSGVPRQHRRSQRQRLLSGRAGEHSRFHQRLHAPDAQPHAHRLAPARPDRAGRARHHTRGHPRAGRRARARGHAVPPAGRGTGWWTASATERGNRIFTTQARHNKRRGPRADK